MDGDDQRRTSQYGQPYQTPGMPRPSPGQAMGPPPTDRYSQPTTPARDDPRRTSMSSSYLPSYGTYGYAQQPYTPSQMQSSSPMSGVEMHYPSNYMSESSRPSQMHQTPPQQSYGAYQSGSMLPPGSAQSMYDQSLHYQQQRQNAALEVMTSHFQMPPYMSANDPTAVAVQPSPSHYMPSQHDQSPYSAVPRSGLQPPFVPSSTEYHIAESEDVAQQQQQRTAQQREALEAGLRDFQSQLKTTFDDVAASRIREASEKVLALTRWLVSSVVGLGFHHDDESKHAGRLELWRELNLCWESLGLTLKTTIEDSQRSHSASTNCLSADGIIQLMEALIELGDQLEPYGLVDYEMGLWEEEITHIFGECLDLFPREGVLDRAHAAPG